MMKRQKRDKHERAFSRGFQAGIHGKNQDLCPYSDQSLKSEWLGGWREGYDDRIHGVKV
tara:strand:+ start:2561 stop:2737 length:177 start_codon:yes stop_codon:yes gene_type:complete